jgi:hypothetical protein
MSLMGALLLKYEHLPLCGVDGAILWSFGHPEELWLSIAKQVDRAISGGAF